jgi:hypothetical protein
MTNELLVTALLWALYASAVMSVIFFFLFIVWLCCRIVGFVIKTLLRWTIED